MGDFNVKVGGDNVGRKEVMGRYGVGSINENGELFGDMCVFNFFVIGGFIFFYKRRYKIIWVSIMFRLCR